MKTAGMDSGFIRRTYRSVAVMAAFVLLLLWSYQSIWAILPVSLGVGLALLLLWASKRVIPQVFKAGGADSLLTNDGEKKKNDLNRRLRKILPIVLVKYLSVGVTAFLLVRFWGQREILAFCGGFVLVQANMVMRVISRMITANGIPQNKPVPFGTHRN